MQVGIELLTDRIDRLQVVLRQKVLQLFEHQCHSREDRRLFAFAAGSFQSELKVIDNCDQAFEQILVRVLNRFLFLASASLLIVFEIGLAAHSQIAKSIQISLHADHFVLLVCLRWRRSRRCRSLLFFARRSHWFLRVAHDVPDSFRFVARDFLHFFLMVLYRKFLLWFCHALF